MKQVAILLLLTMALMLGGCGSTPTSVQSGAGGIWLAELTGGSGQASGLQLYHGVYAERQFHAEHY